MGLLASWGFGAELVFNVGSALSNMRQASTGSRALRVDFEKLKAGASSIGSGLGQISLALAPLGLLFGGLAARSSQLAATLEADRLAMRVLVGDAARSDELIQRIRDNAAQTPFEVGELITSSKRLLRLTGENLDQNIDLLKTMELMAALEPSKSVVDATEALLDATSGGGFERLKEFGLSFRAEDFAAAGRPGGKAWADAVIAGLQAELQKRTRGEDLVGALAETTKGRISTLFDAVNTALTGVGEKLNARGIGWVVALTDGINAAAPAFQNAFAELFGDVGDAVGSTLRPALEWIKAWWDGLGEDGQKNAAKWVIGIGAAVTAFVSLAGVLGVVGILGSGIASVLSGLWTVGAGLAPLLTGAAGTISTAWGGVFALLEGGIGGIFAFLGALPSIFGVLATLFVVALTGAKGFWDWLAQIGGVLLEIGGLIVTGLWEPISGFFSGFVGGLQDAGDQLLATIGGPVLELLGGVRDLFGLLFTSTNESGSAFQTLGKWIGWAFGWVLKLGAGAIRIFASTAGAIVDVLRPLFAAIRLVADAIGGMIDGSLSGSEVVQKLVAGLAAWFGGLGTGLVTAAAWVLETIVNLVGTLLQAIPGVGDALASGAFGAADQIAAFRTGLSEDFTKAVMDAGGARTDAAASAADSSATTADALGESPIDVTVYPTSTVEIDGKEVAKATGRQAVKAGERGTAPKLPEEQRARVLRRGLEVTPLRPAEVS